MAILAHGRISEIGLERRDRRRSRVDRIYLAWLGGAAVSVCLVVFGIIGYIVYQGAPAISWQFLSSPPIEGMSGGGIWPMIRGSLLLMAGTMVLSLPLGILAGICLAEYADQRPVLRLMRACVTTLAGTPPIIYGLFGLAIFVLMFKFGVSLLAGWCTLTLFALPVIILSTETGIRQVPQTFIDGGLALGLTPWQTMRRIILPNAMSSILTGVVLAVSRAAGEATPILFTAGIYYYTGELQLNVQTAFAPVANLPYHLAEGYRQGTAIPEKIIWGTCLVLMLFILCLNLAAILLRTRARRRQQW
ncbi:MAG: phosphate ABC transporter permease PstA [Armatimonadetes bacterium]|nr:phosphate ABC transporter permease PstA [Armatimonadota bacterium]